MIVHMSCYVHMFYWSESFIFFFFKQKTAYEMRISDWSSDVCSSDLPGATGRRRSAVRLHGAPRRLPAAGRLRRFHRLARRRPARRGPGTAGAGPGGTGMQGSPLSSVLLFPHGPLAHRQPVLPPRALMAWLVHVP